MIKSDKRGKNVSMFAFEISRGIWTVKTTQQKDLLFRVSLPPSCQPVPISVILTVWFSNWFDLNQTLQHDMMLSNCDKADSCQKLGKKYHKNDPIFLVVSHNQFKWRNNNHFMKQICTKSIN